MSRLNWDSHQDQLQLHLFLGRKEGRRVSLRLILPVDVLVTMNLLLTIGHSSLSLLQMQRDQKLEQ